jgi:hypothetical protein
MTAQHAPGSTSAALGGVEHPPRLEAVYLHPADKYYGLTRRLSQGQKDLDERALRSSQRPSEPW